MDYSDNAVDKDNTYDKIGKNGIVYEENDNFVIYDKSKAKNEEINKYITLCIKLVGEEKYIYINPNYLKQMQSKNFGKEIESEE